MTSQPLEVQGQSPGAKSQGHFVRDYLIWVYYTLVGLNCYIMSALGPAMPFLRSELSLNYQLAGLHFSSLAVGTVTAGLLGDRVLGRLGRVKCLGASVAGTIFGALLLVAGSHPAVTIAGILLSGFCMTLTYQTLAGAISDHLEELRTFAFVEAEVAAMLGALIAPFAISGFVSAKLGWRAALIVLMLMLAALLPSLKQFGTTRQSLASEHDSSGKLPMTFWSYATVIFLSVCAEWSTAFWSADYLHERLLISKAEAAAAVGLFFAGMVVGRLGGSRLVRKFSPANLLVASGVISIVGFLMFWLGQLVAVSVAGLFFTGLGIANMYPLSFAQAVGAAKRQTAKAIARVSLMCGTALLAAPLLLSVVAEKAGLFSAYSTVTGVLVLCAGSIFWANAISRQAPLKK